MTSKEYIYIGREMTKANLREYKKSVKEVWFNYLIFMSLLGFTFTVAGWFWILTGDTKGYGWFLLIYLASPLIPLLIKWGLHRTYSKPKYELWEKK